MMIVENEAEEQTERRATD